MVALRLEICLRHDHVEPRGGDIIEPPRAQYRKPHPRIAQEGLICSCNQRTCGRAEAVTPDR